MATGMSPSPARRVPSRLARTFFDANILLYADDAAYPSKQRRAADLIEQHARQRTAVISLQVLGEYFNVATRKLNLDSGTAKSQAEFYARFHLVQPSLKDVFSAMDIHRLHRFNYWDCMIIQSAALSGCSTLLSEDMQHNLDINGVRIINPFL
jgi:predicted nucleic acid-binding protein